MSIITHTVAEIKTEYDAHARQWLAYPADVPLEEAFLWNAVEIFPAGREGWRAATLSALTRDVPAVAAWVDALIQGHPTNVPFIDRLLRGALLVRAGAVLALEIGRNGNPDYIAARVRSAATGREYNVFKNGNFWSCECDDYDNGRAWRMGYPRQTFAPAVPGLGTCCKHVAAVYLGSLVQAESQADAIESQAVSTGEYCQPYEDIYR